ncbi:MAG: 6-hydroxymethylpterin diphosphokinase MptE-like protein [Legionellales bacterium]
MDEATFLDVSEQQCLGPLQINAYGDHFFYNLNPETFTNISASDVFDTAFAKGLFNENTLYIIIGTDSCLLPRYISKKEIPNGSRYIFIEPLAILEQLTAEGLLGALDARMACISLDAWSATIEKFKLVDYFYLNTVAVSLSMSATCDKINAYNELHWHIKETLAQFKWQHHFELGSEVFAIQQLANLADNHHPAGLLKDAFAGKTALLLAGGPSLDDVLPWVQEQRAQLVVFAVSRIAKRLLQVNIEPDFIVSIDPYPESFDISKDMLAFGSKSILLHSFHAFSSLVSQWPGTAFYLGSRMPWHSPLNIDNVASPGPTVTNAALNAAYHFGFKRILLAGVDLCFTQDGLTHAKGSDESAAGPRFNLTSLEVETNGGLMAPSSCDFIAANNSLAGQAQMMGTAQCQIINLSSNAAKTEHVTYMPVTDIELMPLECDVQAIVSERLLAHQEPDYFSKATAALKQARQQFNAIRLITAKGARCAERMYQDPNGRNSVKDQRSLRQIERQLNRDLEPFSTFVKSFCIHRFLQITRPFNDKEKTVAEFHQTGMQFFASYQYGTQRLMKLIDDALEKIQARQQETMSQPHWAKLIHQCVKEGSFGRVKRWRKSWPAESLSEHVNSEFAILESRFTAIQANSNTAHLHEVQQAGHIALIKPRADLLFKQKKVDLLSSLQTALDTREDQSALSSHRLLIAGYAAELKLDYPQALNCYHQLVNDATLFLDDALLRISCISLVSKDYENAYLSLYCLAQRNPLCLPWCARMQELRGDILSAVASYNAYIARFPKDTVVQLKLAHLFVQEKIMDAAELLLDYILEKNPLQDAAIHMKQQLQTIQNTALVGGE